MAVMRVMLMMMLMMMMMMMMISSWLVVMMMMMFVGFPLYTHCYYHHHQNCLSSFSEGDKAFSGGDKRVVVSNVEKG